MTTALLDDTTRETLRSKAEAVEELVERSRDEKPSAEEKVQERAERRGEWYRKVENGVLDLANALPAGTEDYEARQLFIFLTELRRAIEEDAEVTDEKAEVELAAMKMLDVLRRLDRRLEHSLLEQPDEAAKYVFSQLDALGATNLARLLGVSTKTISNWKAGKPVKQKTDRVKLIAQVVSYLHYSMTPTGLLLWFENEAEMLGGRSPLELLNKDVKGAWRPLVSYARGGRGQLAG